MLTVNGRVGLVLDGKTLGCPAILMMSGAWPPPAPSVWKLWIARPFMAAIESSMNPHSFRVSVWMAIWMSYSSATVRLVSMTASVVPQSSWSFSPQAPASIISTSGFARLPLPLPRMPTLIGSPSNAWSIRMMFQAPGVQVVAHVPVAEPVPPPIKRGDAAGQGDVDLLRADEVDVGIDAAGRDDLALRRR